MTGKQQPEPPAPDVERAAPEKGRPAPEDGAMSGPDADRMREQLKEPDRGEASNQGDN